VVYWVVIPLQGCRRFVGILVAFVQRLELEANGQGGHVAVSGGVLSRLWDR
jgi:hypothetical protein